MLKRPVIRYCGRLALAALILLPCCGAARAEQSVGAEVKGTVDMPETTQYLVRLIGNRPTWPDDMTPDEEKIMTEHYYYLRRLVRTQKVLLAGPVFDFRFGLIIFNVASEAELKKLMAAEPSVTAGLHTYDYSPMRASLMAYTVPEYRYAADQTDRVLAKDVTVTASLDDVWQAWTTSEGVTSFFSPHAKIELRLGGPYEIYFLMDQSYGMRGSEYCTVLSFLPKTMLSFEWNAPPDFGDLRFVHTRIVLEFDDLGDGQVKVTLSHLGWGSGEEWDKLYAYFDNAWGYVLSNFAKRFGETSEGE